MRKLLLAVLLFSSSFCFGAATHTNLNFGTVIAFGDVIQTPTTSAPAWTPASLPNLTAWYEASDYTTNGAVATWPDKSGHGYDLTNMASSDRWPVTIPADLNSQDVVYFDNAATNYLVCGLFTNAQPFEVDAVVNILYSSTAYAMFFDSAGASPRVYAAKNNAAVTTWEVNAGSTRTLADSRITNAYHVVRMIINGAKSQIYTNNTLAGTLADPGTNGLGGLAMCVRYTLDRYSGKQKLAEFVLVSGTNSASDATALSSYWSSKYSLP